jgi:hypothetical protein
MKTQSDARKNQLAKALRANLRRRKQPTRKATDTDTVSNRIAPGNSKQTTGGVRPRHQQ